MIKQIVTEPVPEVVDLLKALLLDAESGRLRSIAIAGVLTGSEALNAWAGHYYPVLLLGELLVVQREVMDSLVDLKNKPAGEGYS